MSLGWELRGQGQSQAMQRFGELLGADALEPCALGTRLSGCLASSGAYPITGPPLQFAPPQCRAPAVVCTWGPGSGRQHPGRSWALAWGPPLSCSALPPSRSSCRIPGAQGKRKMQGLLFTSEEFRGISGQRLWKPRP